MLVESVREELVALCEPLECCGADLKTAEKTIPSGSP
jgi:hypothetical protein